MPFARFISCLLSSSSAGRYVADVGSSPTHSIRVFFFFFFTARAGRVLSTAHADFVLQLTLFSANALRIVPHSKASTCLGLWCEAQQRALAVQGRNHLRVRGALPFTKVTSRRSVTARVW
ncbi:hypothetical protein IE81DRAFT_74692 [Ceraceosorus guamensis]|uniref:Uncharacterized protein n=1 Tax=Ceraceosorus guamensis TaxID=1522189 RepID=A0A316VRI1_9BASI|nr:hypothetical protein IE81DRAFT_74692 [Ceraceosorus guamensis]PWN38791.1 hypothetical protein IE81DRAFT_74692 [Ceraceosorus guamensis]